MELRLTGLFALSLLFIFPTACRTDDRELEIRVSVVENTEANEVIDLPVELPADVQFVPEVCNKFLNFSDNQLRTAVKLDREEIVRETGNDTLKCRYRDEDGYTFINIKILDLNDNVPHFSDIEQVHTHNFSENTSPPHSILSLHVVDGDNGENGTFDISITDGNHDNIFYIGLLPGPEEEPDKNRKQLILNSTVDHEEHKIFNLTITVHDHGNPPLYYNQTVVVVVLDANDNGARFATSSYNFELFDDGPIGLQNPFGSVEAIDMDSTQSTIVYSLSTESNTYPHDAFDYVDINNVTGELYLKKTILYEDVPELEFKVKAIEVGRSDEDIAFVNVTIIDSDEGRPEIEIINYPSEVMENTLPSHIILLVKSKETPLVKVQSPIQYNLTTKNSLFRIIFIGNETLDRERQETVTVTITAYDNKTRQLNDTRTIIMTVLDENDNFPSFTQDAYTVLVGEDIPPKKPVTRVKASDPDLAENGSISYAISSVNPITAEHWFDIDSHTGEISVNASLDYHTTASVNITVTASDNGSIPRKTSTTVGISISPAVTFKSRSYQEHCSPDIKIRDASKIYIEFKTSEKNGWLLYQETPQNEPFVLGIENGKLIVSSENLIETTVNVSTNNWISVLYDSKEKTLEVWYTENQGGKSQRDDILRASKVVRCDLTHSTDHTFFVGGIDVFSFENANWNSDFVGIVRNLVIDSAQVDLASPTREENTVRGALFSSEPKCGDLEMSCSGARFTGCLDYDMESHCVCAGGFNTDCKDEANYAPIQLASSSMIELKLVDYSLFYDVEQQAALRGSGTAGSRKRRSSIDGYQKVEFYFRLLTNSTGTLLHSQTEDSIHQVQINEVSSMYSMQYKISTRDSLPTDPVHFTTDFVYTIGKLYKVVIIFNSTHVTASFNGTLMCSTWPNNIAPFVRFPQTVISLGGTNDLQNTTLSNFTGCITRLAVNDIEFPLNGLVGNKDPSVKISGGNDVHTTCDLCQQAMSPCSRTFSCVNHVDYYECKCPTGTEVNDTGECSIPPTASQTAPLNTETTTSTTVLPIYIAGAIGAGCVVIVTIVAIVVCCLIYKRYRVKQSKKTYHVGGDNQLPQLGNGERSRPNSYTKVTTCPSSSGNPEPGYYTVGKHNHDSSVSTTCNEHDIDEDNDSNLQNMTRSKSSTSGETGFHTASERDERSIPRMEDSGNEKESDDYSYDTESDDESQSCFEDHSTANMRLKQLRMGLTIPPASSASDSSGPISNLGEPLTPKEKKFITPLRPDSRSELDEETDLDTDFSSTVFGQLNFAQRHRGGSLKLKERPDKVHGQQWYNVSTSSDTERERKRAKQNRVHFPQPQFRSFRSPRTSSPRPAIPRAASSSPSQRIGVPHIIPMTRKSSSPINEPHLPKYRPKRKSRTVSTDSPPISPLTSYNSRTLPSHVRQKERDTSKADDSSGVSTPVLSRSQPLKTHPLFRQSSDSPRIPSHLACSYIPTYMRSYSEESRTCKGERKFVDLGSVRTNCDPIQYWEGQTRMMATVDQVDAFPVLSELYTPFDDSAAESQQSGPEHQSFSSQGGGEGTAEALDVGGLLKLRDCDTDSVATETTLKGSEAESKLLHFPSADCSEEYRCSSQIMPNAHTSSSGSNVFHKPFSIPPSQGSFEV